MSLNGIHQDNKKAQGIDDDKILDTMHMLQGVEVDLLLVELEFPVDFSILQSLDIWFDDTSAKNGTTDKKGTMSLRTDKSSSGMVGTSSEAV